MSGCRHGAPDGKLIAHQWRLSIKEKTTAGEQLKEFWGDNNATLVTSRRLQGRSAASGRLGREGVGEGEGAGGGGAMS